MKFNIGDKVIINHDDHKLVDVPGTIVGLCDDGKTIYGVQFDDPSMECEFPFTDVIPKYPGKNGVNCFDYRLTLAEKKEEKKMKKFNIGDKVMFRYADDLKSEFEVDNNGWLCGARLNGDINLPARLHLCGRIATVVGFDTANGNETLLLENWSDKTGDLKWDHYQNLFCLVEKAAPKKKLTVAEVEKALGYGVEIVKEGK
jgi:hypothetical protein